MPRTKPLVRRNVLADPNRTLVDRPHPDDRIDPGKAGRPGTIRRVTVNLRENPIDWLHARGHLNDWQFAAGARLRADFERAQLGARTTMQWDGAGTGGGRRGAPGAPDRSAKAIDAKRRFEGALAAAGPGRLVLTLALDRVAGFYGLG